MNNIKRDKLRNAKEFFMFSVLRMAALINIIALFSVCGFLIWNGIPAISWEFLTEAPRFPFLEKKTFLVFSFDNNLNNISYIIVVFIFSFILFQISKGDILMKLAP